MRSGCWFILNDGTASIYVDILPSNFVIPQKSGEDAKVYGEVTLKNGDPMIIGKMVKIGGEIYQMNFFTLAAKNLTRRRGRTLLTVLGVAIAISVLFSLLALNSGYEKELNKEVNSLGVHILAVPKGCPYEAASLIIHGGVIPKYLSAIGPGERNPHRGCRAGHAHAHAPIPEKGREDRKEHAPYHLRHQNGGDEKAQALVEGSGEVLRR